jgi:hypothetical protein
MSREPDCEPQNTAGPSTGPLFTQSAVNQLASTSTSFLVSSSPLNSRSALPTFKPMTISPFQILRYADLLSQPVQTSHEHDLHNALAQSEARDVVRKEHMVSMQAGVVLANICASKMQGQLQAWEERKKKKVLKRLMGDGKAKLFSGDDFYALCVEDEARQKREAAAAEQRLHQREAHGVVLAAWKAECGAVQDHNQQRKLDYEQAMAEWEAEKAVAKEQKRRPKGVQPRWRQDYKPEKLPGRPKKTVEEDGAESGGEDGEVDNEMDNDA